MFYTFATIPLHNILSSCRLSYLHSATLPRAYIMLESWKSLCISWKSATRLPILCISHPNTECEIISRVMALLCKRRMNSGRIIMNARFGFANKFRRGLDRLRWLLGKTGKAACDKFMRHVATSSEFRQTLQDGSKTVRRIITAKFIMPPWCKYSNHKLFGKRHGISLNRKLLLGYVISSEQLWLQIQNW